jgi:hypothetical protein
MTVAGIYFTRHGFVICRQKAESRKAESRRKMALQTALWFLFAFCFLLFISQVYTEQSISNAPALPVRRKEIDTLADYKSKPAYLSHHSDMPVYRLIHMIN